MMSSLFNCSLVAVASVLIESCIVCNYTEFMEDAPADPAESPAPSLPPTKLSTPGLERETYKKLDLTKPVLAAHTQKEEQAFLYHFRELRGVHAFKPNSHHLGRRKEPAGEHGKRKFSVRFDQVNRVWCN